MAGTLPKVANLNLKISEDERWAFKELCVRNRMSQVDGFRLAMRLLEQHLDEGRNKEKGKKVDDGNA